MNWVSLLVSLVLLIANGFFVGAEFALTAARRTKLEQLHQEGNRRAKVALRSIRELSLMLAGAQLGITMASLGLGYIAEPAVAHGIEGLLDGFIELPSGASHTIALVVALSIVVFFHMVVGEMAPKNIAIAEPERSALWLAVPFRLYVLAFRPFIHALNAMANGTLRLLRVEPVDELTNIHTTEELGALVQASARGGMIGGFERRLLA
ncbi:MAG: CNNM domain-containing protein [Actinomycetota bacterium]